MDCGLPYALALQIAYPERKCVAFVRDGGFAMLMGEFADNNKYSDVESTNKMAMKERMLTIVEAYVVPFKPPCRQNQTSEYVRNMAESFAKRHMQEE